MSDPKQFVGTCVDNPFGGIETLTGIVENNSIEISKQTFLRNCSVDEDTIQEMKRFPHDFEFYKSRVPFSRTTVYFFCHSAIEHFYT